MFSRVCTSAQHAISWHKVDKVQEDSIIFIIFDCPSITCERNRVRRRR